MGYLRAFRKILIPVGQNHGVRVEPTTRAEAERDRRIGRTDARNMTWILLAIHSTTAIDCGDPVSLQLGAPAPHPADGHRRKPGCRSGNKKRTLGVGQSTEIVDR